MSYDCIELGVLHGIHGSFLLSFFGKRGIRVLLGVSGVNTCFDLEDTSPSRYRYLPLRQLGLEALSLLP